MEPYYPSDLSDAQWKRVEPLLPAHDPKKGGRPRLWGLREILNIWGLREILNAIFYIEKTGCQWRMLPQGFPPKETVWKETVWKETVWQQFRGWRDDKTLENIRLALNQQVRQKVGRASLPSVVIADSQSVKTAQKGGHAASTAAS
jgi:putative transposase